MGGDQILLQNCDKWLVTKILNLGENRKNQFFQNGDLGAQISKNSISYSELATSKVGYSVAFL